MIGKDICKMAAKGNADAEQFCLSWVETCHLLDDIADKDKPITDEYLSAVFATFITNLSANPFFVAHRAMLLSLMIQSFNYWCESNRKETYDQRTRDVLKGFYHCVIWQVAFIVGGHNWGRKVTQECEEFDYEKENFGPIVEGGSS